METTTPKVFVFVLTPFDRTFDDVYRLGIKDACKEAGAYCERLDEQIFVESMLDRIYNQIAKADLVVADMTGRNPNVFYEVGYAHALGKHVVLLTRDANDIPFDLKHHYHIVYGDSIVDLKTELQRRVKWYVENPCRAAIPAEDGVEFYIHGHPLKPGLKYEFFIRPEHVEWDTPASGTQFPASVYLEISVHNNDRSRVAQAVFDVILIVPGDFPRCILYSDGADTVYDTTLLPGGMVSHAPVHSFSVRPGGWTNVPFNIECLKKEGPPEGECSMVLRILTDGPSRDIPFVGVLRRKPAKDDPTKKPTVP